MVWTTWRQHRWEALTAVIVGLVFTVAVLLTGREMHSAFDAQGLAGCLPVNPPANCGGVVEAFQQRFGAYVALYQWLNTVPLLLGIFVGAPLVSREIERSTHLLAWTQGVTRTRWISVKVAFLAAGAVVAGTLFAVLMSWWRAPLDAIAGSGMRPDAFDLEGIVPVGYFVAALSIGIAAGTLTRRTIPAMGAAVIGFLALRFGTIAFLRPSFMPALAATGAPGSDRVNIGSGPWILNDNLVDASGHSLSGRFAFDQLCPGPGPGTTKDSLSSCLAHHGVVESIAYQPADRFWAFQGIELGLFLAVSGALLFLTVWWVRRRIS